MSSGLAPEFSYTVTNRERQPSPVTAIEIQADPAGNAILIASCSDNAIKLCEVRARAAPCAARAAPPLGAEAPGLSGVLTRCCARRNVGCAAQVPNFERRGIILGHTQPCRALCLGPGNSFFSAGMDTNVKVWEFCE